MISFRYHVVSIVAVLLALALGVLLGGGPLQGRMGGTLVGAVATERRADDALEGRVADLQRSGAFHDRFAATAAPGLVGGTLRGHVVALVVLPTARESDVATLQRMVRAAGGSTGGEVRVGRDLLDAGEKQLVDELGSQLLGRARGVRVPQDVGPYDRIATLVGRAVAVRARGGAAMDGTATSILAGLGTAGLVSAENLDRRGDLVLFVTGAAEGSTQEQLAAGTILGSLVRSVDAQSGGAVLAGPLEAGGRGGPVAAVRGDDTAARAVSTVDSLGSVAGAVVTVLALHGQAAGRTGHYGAVDAADGAMPGIRRATG